MAQDTLAAADAVTEAGNGRRAPGRRTGRRWRRNPAALQAAAQQLAEELAEIDDALRAIEMREIFKTADDLVQRDRAVAALAPAADQALAEAGRERDHHARAVDDAGRALGELRQAAERRGRRPGGDRGRALADAGLPAGGLPEEVRTVEHEARHSVGAAAHRA